MLLSRNRLLSLLLCGAAAVSCDIAAFADGPKPGYAEAITAALNCNAQRDYVHAATILEGVVARATDEHKPFWEAMALGTLGGVYQKAGRYAESETVLNRAIFQWTRLKGMNAHELVGPIGNLGGLYYEAGQYSLAERELTRAIEIENATDNKPGLLATLLNNLGNVYYEEHKDTLAIEAAERALQKYQLSNDHRGGSASSWSLLGALYIRTRQLPEAENCLQQALSIWQSLLGPEDPHTGEGVANLAAYYKVSGQLRKAEPLYQEANEIFQKSGGNRTFIQEFLGEYAELEHSLGHGKLEKRLMKKVQQMANSSAHNTVATDILDASPAYPDR